MVGLEASVKREDWPSILMWAYITLASTKESNGSAWPEGSCSERGSFTKGVNSRPPPTGYISDIKYFLFSYSAC